MLDNHKGCLYIGPISVWVGFPNPLGGETSPLYWDLLANYEHALHKCQHALA